MLRVALFVLALGLPTLSTAASIGDLATALKAAGRNPSLGAPAELKNASYSDAVRIVDQLNQTDFRRLADAVSAGRIDLPDNILSAIEPKYPRIRSQSNGR